MTGTAVADGVARGTGRSPLSLGLRYMVAGAFFFSLMSLLVKVAGQRLPSQQIVLARSLVMVVLAGLALRRLRHPLAGTPRADSCWYCAACSASAR
jgi:hypothetical protein